MAKRFNTFTQNGKDWEEGVNYERMRKERLQKARDAMAKNGLGAMIVFRAENIRYITGIRSQMQRPGRYQYYTILPIEGDPVHFELGGDLGRVKENAPWMAGKIFSAMPLGDLLAAAAYGQDPEASKPVGTGIIDSFIEQIYKVLNDYGVSNQLIGIDEVPMTIWERFQKSGLKVRDGRKTMFEARAVKTQDELELCFITATVADACFQTIKDTARPGVRECEVWGEVANTAFRLGAELVGGILTTGGRTNPYYRLMGSDKILAPGDLLVSDIVMNVMGYYSCTVRTFLIGDKPATSEQKAAHREAYELLYKSINACKPGVSTAKVAETFADQLNWETYSLQTAHGLGQSVQESPMLNPRYAMENPVILQPGMYIAFEDFVGLPDGSQGVRLEDDAVITEDGIQVFTRFPFDERLM